jgi:hypothetical protein
MHPPLAQWLEWLAASPDRRNADGTEALHKYFPAYHAPLGAIGDTRS